MRIAIIPLSLLVCLLVSLAPALRAQEEAPPAPAATEPAKEAAPASEEEEIIFERLTGLYFEGRVGAFFTLGGVRGYSNGQPYFGFELGYDITEHFSIQLSYASGYQAANPLKYNGGCTGVGCEDYCTTGAECADYHMDFGLTFFNLSADYDLMSGERWAWEIRAGGGVTIIAPSAKPDQSPVDGDVFGGMRFEYYTLLKHFTVGLEADFYYVIPTGIPAIAGAFSILYNF